MELSNGLIITWGQTTETGNFVVTLPTSYTTYFVPMASINEWIANNAYSICTIMENTSQIRIDHWYGTHGNTESLTCSCSYFTIGY